MLDVLVVGVDYVGNHVVVWDTMHVLVVWSEFMVSALHVFLIWPYSQSVKYDSTTENDVLSTTTSGCNELFEIHTSLHQTAMVINRLHRATQCWWLCYCFCEGPHLEAARKWKPNRQIRWTSTACTYSIAPGWCAQAHCGRACNLLSQASTCRLAVQMLTSDCNKMPTHAEPTFWSIQSTLFIMWSNIWAR
jgi:hypothetical protein